MADTARLRMNLLGDEVRFSGTIFHEGRTVSGVKEKLFLARLAAAHLVEEWPEAVPREVLRGAMWPKSNLDSDTAARNRDLGNKRCDINRALGVEAVESIHRGKAYRLRLEVVLVDVLEMKRAVEVPDPSPAELETRLGDYREAQGQILRRYRGYNPGDVQWIGKAEAEIEKLYLLGLARLVSLHRDAGRLVQAMEHRAALDNHKQSFTACAALRSSLRAGLPGIQQMEREKARADGLKRSGDEASAPATYVVRSDGGGTHATLGLAIEAAQADDYIFVEPGLYRESLLVTKPLHIVGRGDRGDIVIESQDATTATVHASMVSLSNLGLRQKGSGDWCAVDIQGGAATLENCDVSGEGSACVRISGGSSATLIGNYIHGGLKRGVLVSEGADGVLEDNDIFHNAGAGVEITGLADPTLTGNRIYDNESGDGVLVHDSGRGTLEGNVIFGNTFAGVSICLRGEPILRGNTIHHNQGDGVFAQQDGRGLLQGNVIYGNKTAGVSVKTRSHLVMLRNTIKDGKMDGVYVHEAGHATLEDNDITGNALSGVAVTQRGVAELRGNRINGNRGSGVRFTKAGSGKVEGNDLRSNRRGAFDIASDCQAGVRCSGSQE